MKIIEKTIKKLGYKKTGKDFFGAQMFEKGNKVIYLKITTFKKQKKTTFEQESDRIFKK